mmetsp:Transcript_26132/g.67780  ORF Transcript_26132/g.67780 Transcript_26132/m.67780 type:complete len:264 (-) Transcript_26132:725-1516(-)
MRAAADGSAGRHPAVAGDAPQRCCIGCSRRRRIDSCSSNSCEQERRRREDQGYRGPGAARHARRPSAQRRGHGLGLALGYNRPGRRRGFFRDLHTGHSGVPRAPRSGVVDDRAAHGAGPLAGGRGPRREDAADRVRCGRVTYITTGGARRAGRRRFIGLPARKPPARRRADLRADPGARAAVRGGAVRRGGRLQGSGGHEATSEGGFISRSDECGLGSHPHVQMWLERGRRGRGDGDLAGVRLCLVVGRAQWQARQSSTLFYS